MSEAFVNGLELTVIGLAVVFFVLALMALMVSALRRLDAAWLAAETAREADGHRHGHGAQPASVGDARGRPPDQNIDDLTLVLISAAVATVLQGRGRIRRIRRLPPGGRGQSVWAVGGRMTLQGSHVLPRQRGGRGK